MSTNETTNGIIPDDLKALLQELLANPHGGICDPERARKACEHMDKIREENRRLFGETNIAVEVIRQTRDRR